MPKGDLFSRNTKMWTNIKHASYQTSAAHHIWGQWRKGKSSPGSLHAPTVPKASLPGYLPWVVEEGAQISERSVADQDCMAAGQVPLKVTFGGGGIFFWWELGAIIWLSENYNLGKIPMAGASSGALAAILAACNVDPFKALDVAHRLGNEYQIYERPLGLIGVWGDIIRLWLDELLPEDAAELCRGRVEVIVTTVPFLELKAITDYQTKDELIDAALASAHVPFVLDGKFATSIRGEPCFDGSFHDFLNCNNSSFLTCEGKAVLFDYFQDESLQFERLDFLSLKEYDEVVGLMAKGYKYAAEQYKKGVFDDFDTSSCTGQAQFYNSILRIFRKNSSSRFGERAVVN